MLDHGGLPGWTRTGSGFSALLSPIPTPTGEIQCPFYGEPGEGSFHVYGGSPPECALLQTPFPRFVNASPTTFYVILPNAATGACPEGTSPLYRLRGRSDATQSRVTSDASTCELMLAAGYIGDGHGGRDVIACAPTSAVAMPLAAGTTFSPPLRITQGGTYSGNWQSLDPAEAAVVVDTTDPVIIENCTLRGRANLISAGRTGISITVRNCRGYGLDPGVAGQERGAFLEAFRIARLTFEHNYMEGVAEGLVLIEYGGAADGGPAIRIRYNRLRNLMGLYSDGQDGVMLAGDFGNEGNGNHGVILDKLQQLPGVEIAWNEIVNDAYLSSVGDKINFYRSSGTAQTPIDVHDNFVRGGYGVIPTLPDYTGGGVVTDGTSSDSADTATAFVKIHDNQFVSGPNFGTSIAAGHDNASYNNRAFSTGQLSNGQWMAAPYGNAFVVWNCNCSAQSSDVYFNNMAHDNIAGWLVEQVDGAGARVPPAQRHDYYLPGCAAGGCTSNASVADPVTTALEDNEYALWLQKLSDNAIVVGPAILAAVAGRIQGIPFGGAESIGPAATKALTTAHR